MANQFGLSIDPADFGIAQPNQGALEAEQVNADIQNQLANALNGLRGLQAFGMANAKASIPNTPIDWSVTHDENGEPSITAKNLRPEQIDYFQQASKFYQEALGGFAQQANQLQMQLQQAQQQPWQQLATALSANLAMQKDMPGWVQGLGRTAAQLNPSVDELRARYLATTGKGAEIAEKGMALGIAQQRTQAELMTKLMDMGDKDRREVEIMGAKLVAQLRLATRHGEAPSRETVANAVALIDPEGKMPKAAIDHAVQLATGLAATAKEGLEARLKRQETLIGKASELALDRGIKLAQATAPIKASLMREAFSITHGQAALDFEAAKKEVDNAAAVALAQARTIGVLDASAVGMLRAGQGTNTYLSSMKNMLNIPEIASAAEPAFLVDRNKDGTVKEVRFNPEAVLPQAWKSMPRTQAENMIAHEMPRILALLFKQGVGAQMFRSAKGVELLNALGVTNKIRVDQMMTILENIRHTNNLSNFAPVITTKPNIPWLSDPNYKAMIAADDPENALFYSGKDQFGGNIPFHFATPAPKAGGKNDPLGIR